MLQARKGRVQSVVRGLSAIMLTYALAVASGAQAGYERTAAVKKFFGSYEGYTISSQDEGLTKRDLNIEIKPFEDEGFTVAWTTVLRKADGKERSKAYTVNFLPSSRSSVYAAAAKKDLFGHMKPLNPLEGDPYVWAAIDGDTLTVRSLHIGKTGGYEIQVYGRTLTKDGMATRFERIRDGQNLKIIEGMLKRVSK
ncbi:MAG: hypothetical protein ACR2PO_20425 [Methyloligellaceae bacterium]